MTNIEKHKNICKEIENLNGNVVNGAYFLEDLGGDAIYREISNHMQNYKRAAQDAATAVELTAARKALMCMACFALTELCCRVHAGILNHSDFEDLLAKMTETYKRKNADYGDSFHESFKEYGFTMTKIRIEDKVRRLNSLISEGYKRQVSNESIDDTLLDLANYCVLSIMELDEVEKTEKSSIEYTENRLKESLAMEGEAE